jgi:hypothetical protein
MKDTSGSHKKRIVDILEEANAARDAMGSNAFHDAIHRDDQTPALIELKEKLALGQFAQFYNQTNTPKLIYARANAPGSGGADFTVWDETQSWTRDLELTSVWGREDDFPRYTDENHPHLIHVDLSSPRRPLEELRRELTKHIKSVVKKHARRTNYPAYWLAIYVTGLHWYNFSPDYVANTVSEALVTRPPSSNVERVWVWNPELLLAFLP